MFRRDRNAVLMSVAALALCATVRPVPPALALGDTVMLDNVTIAEKDGGSVVFKHIEFSGTNLSRDEVASLFSANLSTEVARPLVAKMTASKISIPEIRVNFKDGSALIHDVQANNVNSGRVGLLSIAAIEAMTAGKDGPPVSVKTNPFTLENADFSPFLRGAEAKPEMFKFSKLSWAGMEASYADKETPADAVGGNFVHIRIASVAASNQYQGELFSKGVSELKGLAIEAPKASKLGKSLAPFGYNKLEFDMQTSGAYDSSSKTLAIDNFTLNGVDIGAMTIRLQLGSLDNGAFGGDVAERLNSWLNSDIANIEMRLTNAGLFDRAVAYFADQQHQSPEEIRKNWSSAASQIVAAAFSGSPEAASLSTAISEFITAPKSLTLSAHGKAGPIAIKELQELKTLPAILARVNFSAVANQH